MSLYLKIIEASNQWRDEGYPCEQYPAIKYILQYNYQSDTGLSLFALTTISSIRDILVFTVTT